MKLMIGNQEVLIMSRKVLINADFNEADTEALLNELSILLDPDFEKFDVYQQIGRRYAEDVYHKLKEAGVYDKYD